MGKCGLLRRGVFSFLLLYASIPSTILVGPDGSARAKGLAQACKIYPGMQKTSVEADIEALDQPLLPKSLPAFDTMAKGTNDGQDPNLRDFEKASEAPPTNNSRRKRVYRLIARLFPKNEVQKTKLRKEDSANDGFDAHISSPTTQELQYEYSSVKSMIVLLPGPWYGSDEQKEWSLEELQGAVGKRESYLNEQREAFDKATFEMSPVRIILSEAQPYPAVKEFIRNTVIDKDFPSEKHHQILKQAFKELLRKKEITFKEAALWVQCFAHISRVGQVNLQKPQLEAMIQYGLLDLMARFRPIWREDNPPRQDMYEMIASLYNALQKRCTSAKNSRNYKVIFKEAGQIPWVREILFPEAGVGTRINWNPNKIEEWFRKNPKLCPYFTNLNDLIDSDLEGAQDIIKALGQMGRKDNLETSARTKTASICLLLYVHKISEEQGSPFRKLRVRVFQELVQLISKRNTSEFKAWFHDFKLIYASLFFGDLDKVPI